MNASLPQIKRKMFQSKNIEPLEVYCASELFYHLNITKVGINLEVY